MKQDKVATKLEMYQAFRDNLVLSDTTKLKTLPITLQIADIAGLPALELGEKFDCVPSHRDTIFDKVVAFLIEIPGDGRCEALAAVFKLSDDVFEAMVAIKSKMVTNDILEAKVNSRWVHLFTSTESFKLAQKVFVYVDTDELFEGEELTWAGGDETKLLLLNRFVKQRKEASSTLVARRSYEEMLLGEATAYMWHEYLTWVPPDTPAQSV